MDKIKLYEGNGKYKYYSFKEGIKILRKENPDEKFRIGECKKTKQKVIQNYYKTDKKWVCLHD